MEQSSFEVLECIKQLKPRFGSGTTASSSTLTLCSGVERQWNSKGVTKSSELFHHWGQDSIGRNKGKTLFACSYINSYHFSKDHDEDLNLEILLKNSGIRSLATRKIVCMRAYRFPGRKVKEISAEILTMLIPPSHPTLHS